jgi:hypothetical protein
MGAFSIALLLLAGLGSINLIAHTVAWTYDELHGPTDGEYTDIEGWSTVPWVRPFEKGLPVVHYLNDYANVSADVPLGHQFFDTRHPLVFMHQRKSGGSNVRRSLDRYAISHGLKDEVTISCFGKASCLQYTIDPNTPPKFIYAMHSTWNTLWPLFTPRQYGVPEHNVGKVNFTCFTVFREPVSRVKSCFYFRNAKTLAPSSPGQLNPHDNGTCINDLSIPTFTKMLVEGKDAYGNGCLNEPFRLFSSLPYFQGDSVVNNLGFVYDKITNTASEGLDELDAEVLRDTLEHLSNCIPLALELQEESWPLMGVVTPWVYSAGGFAMTDAGTNEQFPYSRKCAAPSAEHVAVMRKVTVLETVLYNAAVQKIHQLVKEKLPPTSKRRTK